MSRRHTRDDIDKFHDYSIYLPTRTIYVGSEEVSIEHGESGTDAAMAERLIKNLHILDAMADSPITVIMDNIGGDVTHGLAAFDAIRACRSRVTVIAYGAAMSMGSVILQAADERVMAPNAVQMLHYGQLGVDGESGTVYRHVKEDRRVNKWMESMYLERIRKASPGFTLRRLQAMLERDTFLTAEQSVEIGLADRVLGEDK